ncbi:MAG: hypothetical protein KGO96_03885 [Elusimicrobia bacterium]|nr:hypothetical protein [Elusimicrobiota bacterium]MDE2238293.1 hypothetical protein [Elusimicrobiota bacterium]MDE2425034.1 hypothetical protein [Elusimicrobiota bacterium]
MLSRALLALLLAASAHAQLGSGGDVLTARDQHGNIAAVYNEFDGRFHSMQIVRMTARGETVWNVTHSNSYYDKAYAAAMDSQADVLLAGERRTDGRRSFLTLKYDHDGNFVWEAVSDRHDCAAMYLSLDRDDNAFVAGVCRRRDGFPVLLVKYSPDGRELWSRIYDGGGRNYLHGLLVDYTGNAMLSVETVFGNFHDGSYAMRTVVFAPDGRQADVR